MRDKPYIVSLYNHSLDAIRKRRLKVIHDLHDQLNKSNVVEKATRMSDKQFNEELEVNKRHRFILQRLYSSRRKEDTPLEHRERTLQQVDKLVSQHYVPKYTQQSSPKDKRPSSRGSTALRDSANVVSERPQSPNAKRKISSVESPKAPENAQKRTLHDIAKEAQQVAIRKQKVQMKNAVTNSLPVRVISR